MIYDIGIVGGGAAGLMAAAQAEAKVCVIERNSALGRKLLKTGGGRCNLTHQAGVEELVRTFGFCGRFLKHALYTFGPETAIQFFADHHLACKIEKDGCVFPITDRATDICRILQDAARRRGAEFVYSRNVETIEKTADGFVLHTPDRSVAARTVILACGGASWPQTGSDGDGFRLAATLGHTVIPPRAAVCPVVAAETWVKDLQGVSLDDVALRGVCDGRKFVAHGAMVFTANGLGGPAAFDLSREITDALYDGRGPIAITADFAPSLESGAMDALLIERCAACAKREAAAILAGLLPRALAIELTGRIAPSHPIQAGQMTKPQRRQLVELMKAMPLTVTALAPLAQATVTRGGVALEEIDPKTMQSRLCGGLFFAGEVINADGPCGGYNLQIAWSTAALAARSAAATKVQ